MPDHTSDPLAAEASQFAATRWSVVPAAGQDNSALALAALETLYRAYWYPLYAHVQRRGYGEHDAKDLTQGFFAHLPQREAFGAVVPGRGSLCSFLLASLNHFLADQHDRQRAQKRGGGQPVFSLDAPEDTQRYVQATLERHGGIDVLLATASIEGAAKPISGPQAAHERP